MSFLYFLEGIRCTFLDGLFLAITALGETVAFMAVSIAVFWCFSKKEGYYILSIGFFGSILSQFLKILIRIPRPWVLDNGFSPVEKAVKNATGYSFPSGHTQSAAGTFGAVALFTKKTAVRVICIVLVIFVAFSRMYLGVHTPLDVGVGLAISVALIFAVRPIINLTEKREWIMYVSLGAMLVFSIAYIVYLNAYSFPSDIDASNYNSAVTNSYTLLGALIGMFFAYPIEKHFIKFEVSGKWYTQAIKCVVGLALCLCIKEFLKYPINFIIPNEFAARAIRYAFLVFFAVAIYPLCFKYYLRLENKIEKWRKSKYES